MFKNKFSNEGMVAFMMVSFICIIGMILGYFLLFNIQLWIFIFMVMAAIVIFKDFSIESDSNKFSILATMFFIFIGMILGNIINLIDFSSISIFR